MKNLSSTLSAFLIITILCVFSAYAQLSGPLSGVITAGTYTVEGDIFVEEEDSLIIEPGVVFEFDGDYTFNINGYLNAVGTESDSIKFMTNAGVSYWKGIDFNDSADDYSRLEYCLITGGYASGSSLENNGGGIECNHSSPAIHHCTIIGNTAFGAYSKGGGICCYYSSPTIANCIISDNTADDAGGGIYCWVSDPTIENCTISENTSSGSYSEGGGISCMVSDPSIQNCTISENSANYGGGISCWDSNPTIENCSFSENISSISYSKGGGINCDNNSNPTIENCTINENSVGDNGGGIYCTDNSSPVFENCTISGNTANSGGGIYCHYTDPTFGNCIICGNTVDSDGGGIKCYQSNPSIENCTISGNEANYGGGISCNLSEPNISNCNINTNSSLENGGGIYCYQSNPAIENCTINGNTALGIISEGGGIYCGYSSPTGVNNIIWANSAPTGSQIYISGTTSSFACTYSDIQGGFVGYGNIDYDPLFVDPSNGDFHLQSASPCIDAGNPASQYNDPEDPANPGFALYPAMGTIVNDMGVYGGQGALGWVGVSEKPAIKKYPESYTLFQNYPNPFNPETNLSFDLPQSGNVSLIIYDIQGREVARLIDSFQSAGIYQRTFDASELSSGVYFACLKAEGFSQTRKLLLIK